MVVDFSKINLQERPVLILKNASDDVIGVLGYAHNTVLDIKYNETSTLEFDLPYEVDGVKVPFYDDVVGMKIIEVVDVGSFTLTKPTQKYEGQKRYKSCVANSLEYEFVYKTISLPEDTYKFYDDTADGRKNSILGIIMEVIPSWRVGTVPSNISKKYRTFSVENTNLYDFMKNTLQQSYNCLFDFDTTNRVVNIRDLSEQAVVEPVFLSYENLAKSIEIEENVEDIVTRLDVNGAEGVDIREVNPTGTNKIIDLEYYMDTSNFSQSLINKYHNWVDLVHESRQTYYTSTVEYMLLVEELQTEQAALKEMNTELLILGNSQALAVEEKNMNIPGADSKYNEITKNVSDQKNKIQNQQKLIDNIQKRKDAKFSDMQSIVNRCKYENYFTLEEQKAMDKYIKDGDISESSFVLSSSKSYSSEKTSKDLAGIEFKFSNGEYTKVTTKEGSVIYSIKGGNVAVKNSSGTNIVNSYVISCVIELRRASDGSSGFESVSSIYLSNGKLNSVDFAKATITASGSIKTDKSNVQDIVDSLETQMTGGSVDIIYKSGNMYFTLDVSDMEKRSVSNDLYDFGVEQMKKMSVPSYNFKISSANFLTIDEFVSFRNNLTIGEKVYVKVNDDNKYDSVLTPICTGVKIDFENINSLELEFGSSYTAGDSEFKLVDLLEQSVSSGRRVELSKYAYAAFIDSGASTEMLDFMRSALDVSKNAIMSSQDQAITWDESGFRMRKWANDEKSAYEKEQIWMNNNSILITDDNWETAKMAIGKVYSDDVGETWGIVAPTIVGKMIAGEQLVIQSLAGQSNDPTGKDGTRENTVAEFRVDKDGVKIYNSDIMLAGLGNPVYEDGKQVGWSENHHLVMTPDLGFAMGIYPIIKYNEEKDEDGNVVKTTRVLNEDNTKFWIDYDGDVHFSGRLEGADGLFTGRLEVLNDSIATVIDADSGLSIYHVSHTTVKNPETGEDEDKEEYTQKFYADGDGNLHLIGNITATSLTIEGNGYNISLGDYVTDSINSNDNVGSMMEFKNNCMEYFEFGDDGFKVSKSGSPYYTLTNDAGFYVMFHNASQNSEEILGEFTSDGLYVDDMSVSKVSGAVQLKGSARGGWIWY